MTKITVTKAIVLQGDGTDTIFLHTTLPYAVWPYEGTQDVKMEAAAGTGPQYVRVHLGIEPEVITMNGTRLEGKIIEAQQVLEAMAVTKRQQLLS